MSTPRIAHFRCDQLTDLESFLKNHVGLSKLRIDTLLEFGAIYVNGERIQKKQTLQDQDVLRIHFQPKRYLVPPEVELVFENEDFVCIDKPAGLPTHATLDNCIENALSITQRQLEHELFLTHRLDIGTEGLLLFAKSEAAQSDLNSLFKDRKIKKIYRALTMSAIPTGRYLHYMNVKSKGRKCVSEKKEEGFVTASLSIDKSWELDGNFACEISLETGRTHQIRAQLSFLGSPVLGDSLYGSTLKFVHERLALECFHISFTHRSRTIGIYRPTSLAAPHSTKDS